MKLLTIILLSAIVISLLSSSVFAEGDAGRGKILFNDPKLGGSSFGINCNTCHPGGKDLEKSDGYDRKNWRSCSGELKSLEDAINNCIVIANKGQAIDPGSQKMKDLTAYIKSLGKKSKKNAAKKKKTNK